MKRFAVSASVACLALLMGCPMDLGQEDMTGENGDNNGPGGDGDGPGGTSGVDEDLPLNGLNSDDAKSLCDWANETIAATDSLLSSPETLCTIYGVGSSQDPASCEEASAQCLESGMFDMPPPPPPDAGDQQACVDGLAEITANCDVTVEELQGCLNDTFAQINELFASLTCDAAGQPPPEPSEPESCKAIDAKCPGLGMGEPGDPGDGGDWGDPGDGPGDPGGEGFPCPDGNFVPPEAVCDGAPDCGGGEDEMFCGDVGPGPGGDVEPGGPTCEDGTPISFEQFCDGNQDCAGGEDEAFCGEPPPDGGFDPNALSAKLKALRPLWTKH